MNYTMNNKPVIIGIDHGYGNIKTAHTCSKTGVTAYDNANTLAAKQAVVYDENNILQLTEGNWRLRSLTEEKYVSGYRHKTELVNNLRLQFHEVPASSHVADQTYGSWVGITDQTSTGTRGAIPTLPVEYDPSAIFYFNPIAGTTTIQSQGLYVNTVDNTATKMSETPENLLYTDIGAGRMMLRGAGNGVTTGYMQRLGDEQTATIATAADNEMEKDAMWRIEPVSTHPLRLALNDSRTGYRYASLYLPFDVQLPEGATAYYCPEWRDDLIKAKPVGTAMNGLTGNGRNVPAATPVIIRSATASDYIELTLPTASPSASITPNVLSGQYLEQTLPLSSSEYLLTFGGPIYDELYLNQENGNIYTDESLSSQKQGSVGSGKEVGFYTNANPDRESSSTASGISGWRRWVISGSSPNISAFRFWGSVCNTE